LIEKYAGVWGGRTDTGEEMWCTSPNPDLIHSRNGVRERARRRFFRDTRQYFILEFLRTAIAGRENPRIADFGCGSGGTTMNFSNYLGVPIEGYDIFGTQLEIGREQAARIGSGCTFRLLEGGKFPAADGAFDVVMSLDVLGHVPDSEATLAEWSRALKPGGYVVLFTESSYSAGDRSIMARLARIGKEYDMTLVVPEHISLIPREKLEEQMERQGFRILDRYSANLAHFFFFPKDYVMLLRGKTKARFWFALAWVWNRLAKLVPFYPQPLEWLRLQLTKARGREAFGTSYFYLLRKP
jgi:2-polyprenyl-3-methyl-5-hydroxy-6-metoxy-1,4-benzoquinol methylase